MRQRKRADWPISVYRYRVQLEDETWECLPAGAKREIEATHALWNQLVDAFAQRQAAYREIMSQLPQGAEGRAAEAVHLALRQQQQSFLAETRRLAAQCAAYWANKRFTLNQFLVAVSRFFKKQSGPPRHKLGTPQEVHFHHQFTDGGLPVDRIFGRGQRLHLEPVPPEAFDPTLPQRQRKRLARTIGTFQVRGATLSFQTLLHRPLPQGAYLKTAALVGRQVVRGGYHRHQGGGHPIPARWVWSLHLTLEHPPQTILTQERETPVGTLALSRRVWGDGQLQIGVLVDSTGREEALFLPEDILKAWRYKRGLQRRADQYREETKALLRDMRCHLQIPRTVQSFFAHLGTVSNAGLWRLLQLLEETSTPREALEILRRWADRTTKLVREARGLERRYLGHRDWFYRNEALQLCRRYQRLVVAAQDPQLTTPQDQGQKNPQLQEDATYRQLASPSRFLVFLRQAAAKTGTELKEVRTASGP